jgi:Calcineurin-like phosphoesterase
MQRKGIEMSEEQAVANTPGKSLVSNGSAEEQVSRSHPSHPSQDFQPLPKPTGEAPYRLTLDDAVGEAEAKRLKGAERIVIHVIGDTGGVKYPVSQQLVADVMARDFPAADPAPAFCYHVGDIVYYNGELDQYYPQFYEPYRDYPASIMGIRGNHDTEPVDPNGASSVAFVRTFCAKSPKVLPEAGDAPRTTMVQPNVYWTLEAPLFTIVGVDTNAPEGGEVDEEQIAWLVGELKAAPEKRALIVALHHPPYSADSHHGGSERMGAMLDEAFAKADRLPDLVLSGHVHNYQRFTRSKEKRQIPYLVVGASGYWHLHAMAAAADGSELKAPWKVPDSDVVLDGYSDDRHGFLRLTIDAKTIAGEYTTVPRPQESWSKGPVTLVDSFSLDLAKHKVETLTP